YFFVKVEYALVKIILSEITHIEGMKDYVKIFITSAARPVLTKSTLKGISEKLPLADFMRVHKSYIVRLDKIESIRGNTISIGKYEIPISESQKTDLLDALDAGG
ncbi:MAG: LytTR family transcriptional regulator, partial [Bacteroidetes bacterium]|nr:LytTR family transcriptional regulator [Bacteroidota bacterium]